MVTRDVLPRFGRWEWSIYSFYAQKIRAEAQSCCSSGFSAASPGWWRAAGPTALPDPPRSPPSAFMIPGPGVCLPLTKVLTVHGSLSRMEVGGLRREGWGGTSVGSSLSWRILAGTRRLLLVLALSHFMSIFPSWLLALQTAGPSTRRRSSSLRWTI